MKPNPRSGILHSLSILLLALMCHAGGRLAAQEASSSQPAITQIRMEGGDIVVTVQVPPGLKKITLQSSSRLGSGGWVPRAVARVDGQGGQVLFTLPRSAATEVVRVRADENEPLPASFYSGTNEFPGVPVSTTANPDVVFFDRTAAGAPVADNGPEANQTRDVVESDIWQIDGDTLYFFNQYRGLQVIDVAKADAPLILGTLSLPAAGEQMYVLPRQKVVLLARSSCGWSTEAGSQALIVDAAQGLPTVITSVPVAGEIQESRMVGTALYVLTQTYRPVPDSKEGAWEWGTVVYAFDLADPAAPVARTSLFYSGYGNVLSATDRYLFVAVSDNSGASLVHTIDISSPDGTMNKGAAIKVAGRVPDKFKMHLKDDVFTVISERWGTEMVNGVSRWAAVTTLETFSLENPTAPVKLGELELGRGEQLHATRFDGDRAYIVTFFRIDPLWVVDLSNPARPEIKGELEVPGWSTYIQPLGDRLLAIGIDNTNGWRVAVSLFDVHDPAAPALLSKVPLGENSSWSEANSDEKAFGFLPDAGLILVPYSSFSTNNQQGVQLIDFKDDTLVKRGFISHDMQARRSALHGGRILSISGRELLSVDATDRDNPAVRAELELAWPVNRVFVQDGFLIELETSASWGEGGGPALRVVRATAPEQALNSLALKDLPIAGATLDGGRLYLLQATTTYIPPVYTADGKEVILEGANKTTFLCSAIDVTQLPALTPLDSAEIESDEPFYGSAAPVWPKPGLLVWASQQNGYIFWRGGPFIDVIDGISLAPARSIAPIWWGGGGESKLIAVDVQDPRQLEFRSQLTLKSTNGWSTFSKPYAADGAVFLSQQYTETTITSTNFIVVTNLTAVYDTNVVYVTNFIKQPNPDGTVTVTEEVTRQWDVLKTPEFVVSTNEQPVYVYRQVSILNVVDFSAPASPVVRPPVTVPGNLQGLSHGGALLYFSGYKVDAENVTDGTEWLHACAYDGVSCFLVDSEPLGQEWPRAYLVQAPYVFVTRPAVEKVRGPTIETWTISDAGKFSQVSSKALKANGSTLLAISDLLVVQQDSGVELLDLNRPTELPTLGLGTPAGCIWWNLENGAGSSRDGLWLPLDFYGVYHVPIKR